MKKRILVFTAILALLLTGCAAGEGLTTSNAEDAQISVPDSSEQPETSQAELPDEQPAAAVTAEAVSDEPTTGGVPEITLHTTAEFSGKYSNPAYDTTDPVEAAKQYVTELNDQPYVFNFEITNAEVYDKAVSVWTDSLRECVGSEYDNVMDSYGWTTDMIDRGIFTVVRVDYYANFDHTQTPTDFEGECYMNVYMVQYEDTGAWQVYDRGYLNY